MPLSRSPSQQHGKAVPEMPELAEAQQSPASSEPRTSSSKWSLGRMLSQVNNKDLSTDWEHFMTESRAKEHKPRHAYRDALLSCARRAEKGTGPKNDSIPSPSATSQKTKQEAIGGSSQSQQRAATADLRLPLPAVASDIPRPEDLGLSIAEWRARYPYTYIANTEDLTNQPFRRPAMPANVAPAQSGPGVTVNIQGNREGEQVSINLSMANLELLLRNVQGPKTIEYPANVHLGEGRPRPEATRMGAESAPLGLGGHSRIAVPTTERTTTQPAAAGSLSAKALGKRPVFEVPQPQSQAQAPVRRNVVKQRPEIDAQRPNNPASQASAWNAQKAQSVRGDNGQAVRNALYDHIAEQRRSAQARQDIGRRDTAGPNQQPATLPRGADGSRQASINAVESSDTSSESRFVCERLSNESIPPQPANAKALHESPASSITPSLKAMSMDEAERGRLRTLGKVFELEGNFEELSMDDEMRQWAKDQAAWLDQIGEM